MSNNDELKEEFINVLIVCSNDIDDGLKTFKLDKKNIEENIKLFDNRKKFNYHFIGPEKSYDKGNKKKYFKMSFGSSNPEKTKKFVNKHTNYYDFVCLTGCMIYKPQKNKDYPYAFYSYLRSQSVLDEIGLNAFYKILKANGKILHFNSTTTSVYNKLKPKIRNFIIHTDKLSNSQATNASVFQKSILIDDKKINMTYYGFIVKKNEKLQQKFYLERKDQMSNNEAFARELQKNFNNEESAGKFLNNGMSNNEVRKLQKRFNNEEYARKLQKEETINEQYARKLQKEFNNELKNNDLDDFGIPLKLSAEDKKKLAEEREKFRLSMMKNKKKAGSYIRGKKVRKHQGIIQTGGNAGRLRKGYRYSGKKLKSGLPQIIKCKSKKC